MDNYNPNIHHRKSIRLKGYDYSRSGLYFITICVLDKKCLFGRIENGEMILNNAGKVAEVCWLAIPEHFPNTVLHEFVVMPNHIHGIVELTVGAENFQPPQSPNQYRRNEFQKMIPHSIGSIVKGFKIGVTKWFRNNTDIESIWLRNYYEHIIRSEKSYYQISEYIINNPKKWKEDKLFKA